MSISGTAALHAVVYISRATRSLHPEEADCIADILRISVVNNRRANVTGALLACDGWFVQALEGRRIDVENTLRRIERDRNHCEVRRLSAGPITERSFAAWNMCASTFNPTDEQIVRALSESPVFNPNTLSAASAMRLLTTVARLQTRPAPRAPSLAATG